MIRRYIIEADDSLKGFDEAIEKLEREWGAEEIEGSEDCVKREDAINALRKALYDYEDKTEKQFKESKELNFEDWFQHRIFIQNMNDIDVQTILKLPYVQPQPKRGKWIGEESLDGSIRYMCDNCKEFECVDYYDFCPNCGAKMREVQDEQW